MAKSNSPKYRDYFITINEGAESYNDALEIVKELNFKLYGLIIHDKDMIMNDETGEFTEHKKTHKHIMVELKNPVSFQSIQNKFKGAHIEVPKYKKSAYQYLIHNLPTAREKYQYDFKEIITNSPIELENIITSETFELFKENMFLQYIADGVRTSYQFAKRFGLNAYKQYWRSYYDMVLNLDSDDEMRADLETLTKARQLNDDELPF